MKGLINQSYTANYLRIYLMQALSVLVGFASVFVVVPNISSDPSIYGIYSVCTSITIFLSYADLGFLGAGVKFAAEYYARDERNKELGVIGFTHFIFLIVVILISLVFLILSYNPSWLIKDITGVQESGIAHRLLFILAVFSPIVVIQRMMQIVFSIRLQEYKVQRVITLGNVFKILSVFVFFNKERYDIVGYYLTFNIINFLVAIINVVQAKFLLGIDIRDIFKSLRFSKDIYNKVKSLAFSTFIGSFLWIVFYELDTIVIGRVMGAQAVAIYAVGLTLLSFIRSFLGIFFSPFSARFNHFIGLGQVNELKSFFFFVQQLLFFISVIPLLTLSLFSEEFVMAWLGIDYTNSIPIISLLALCNLLAFVQYPTGNLLVAKQNIKAIYMTNIIPPIIYWLGIIITVSHLGVLSFAVFKCAAFMILGIIYIYYSIKFLEISLWSYFRKVIVPYLPAILVVIIICILCKGSIHFSQGLENLVLFAVLIGCIFVLALLISLLFVKPLRDYLIKLLKLFRNNDIQ